jgi:uncharacterized membrane protein
VLTGRGYAVGMRSRALVPVAALLASSAWCLLLVAVRKHEFGSAGYPYLAWNLTLAWIPLVLALVLLAAYKRGAHSLELLAVGALWLLFLPNAPYMLTDLIHLGDEHRLFDVVVLASFAFTALALGFASLLLVQVVVTRRVNAAVGWAVVLGSLFASSVGMYLGRVQRLNSWDIVQRPSKVWSIARLRLDDPFGNRYLIGFVVAVCGFLTLAYVGLYGFTTFAAAVSRDDR